LRTGRSKREEDVTAVEVDVVVAEDGVRACIALVDREQLAGERSVGIGSPPGDVASRKLRVRSVNRH
jgi:hypothetical protein